METSVGFLTVGDVPGAVSAGLPQSLLLSHRSPLPRERDRYQTGAGRFTDVDLSNTQVADAGVAELQKALPNCRITR